MKANLIELLLNLFEKTLTQLRENSNIKETDNTEEKSEVKAQVTIVKEAQKASIRLLSYEERHKMTDVAYKLLMHIISLNLVSNKQFEEIINLVFISESPLIGVDELKWIIHKVLASTLNAEQVAFLDLVLYHKEGEKVLH